jgi:hypothetical protein
MMLPVVVSSPVKMAIWALFGVAYEVARSWLQYHMMGSVGIIILQDVKDVDQIRLSPAIYIANILLCRWQEGN